MKYIRLLSVLFLFNVVNAQSAHYLSGSVGVLYSSNECSSDVSSGISYTLGVKNSMVSVAYFSDSNIFRDCNTQIHFNVGKSKSGNFYRWNNSIGLSLVWDENPERTLIGAELRSTFLWTPKVDGKKILAIGIEGFATANAVYRTTGLRLVAGIGQF